ncbi:MAG: glutamate-1-semialdehyde 2,1-aminomutase [Gemmatimonadaceae bacterium]|nr:glutamate-1-semialdehyde 2,1-aminomutase [Gemmatimonadaceae bacterium]
MARSRAVFPGGVSSPVRAFGGVGGDPIVMASGKGARMTDVDGNEYIDYVLSWGSLVLGHAHPDIIAAVRDAAALGTSFGTPTELEVQLGELVKARMPHLEMLRFVSSGTEAMMSAVRLARAYTGRNAIIKFDGCYHGHADSFLVRAGSGVATLGLPNSPGVPECLAALTLVAPFNDTDAVRTLVRGSSEPVAAIVVEPIVGNAGLILPKPGFLRALREIADETGALLVFDEVMTGFRVAPGGAAGLHGVIPDITALGKVIGGGLPVAAYGGKREIMARMAPDGPVYQAGTLSGNPLAMAAGLATLRSLTPELHREIEGRTARLVAGLRERAAALEVGLAAAQAGSMWGFFFAADPVYDLDDAKRSDTAMYARFFHAALARGVYLAPSAFEAAFMSSAHSNDDVDLTVELLGDAIRVARA